MQHTFLKKLFDILTAELFFVFFTFVIIENKPQWSENTYHFCE